MFLGSLAAIAALVGVCWALGFRVDPVLADTAEAERIADAALTGFRARDIALGADRRGALLRGHDERLVLVRPVGDHWVVRDVRTVRADGDTVFVPGGLGEPATRLVLADAGRWAT